MTNHRHEIGGRVRESHSCGKIPTRILRTIALSTVAALGLSGIIALAGPAQAGSAWGTVSELSDASYNSEEAMLAGVT